MLVSYERSILFTFIAISCMRTTAQCKKNLSCYRKSQPDAPRVSWMLSVDACPSTRFVDLTTDIHTSRRCVPSITTSMLLTRPYTTLSVWVAVILDSSRVSWSRRWRIDSMSLSPSSFLAIFSATGQTIDCQWDKCCKTYSTFPGSFVSSQERARPTFRP